VNEGKIKKRAERMRELGRQKRQAFYHQFLHQELSVLVEDRREKGSGRWKGFSRNYIPILLTNGCGSEGYPDWINQEWRVRVTELSEHGAIGRVVGRVNG
jgi:tRNA A37 methylthiotransferase MiaB